MSPRKFDAYFYNYVNHISLVLFDMGLFWNRTYHICMRPKQVIVTSI